VKTETGRGEALVYVMNLSQPELGVSYAIVAIGTERSHVGRKFLKDTTCLRDQKEIGPWPSELGAFCLVGLLAFVGVSNQTCETAGRRLRFGTVQMIDSTAR
jgi:hypothetical protein